MDEPQNPSFSQETRPAQVVPQAPIPQPAPTPVPMTPPAAPAIPMSPTQAPTVDLSGNRGMAILAYLGVLIIVPFLGESKNDPFVKFHIKQGLGLIIVWIAAGILSSILSFVLTTIGGLAFIISFLFPIIYLGIFVVNIVGLINAATGKTKSLPIIGGLGAMFNF